MNSVFHSTNMKPEEFFRRKRRCQYLCKHQDETFPGGDNAMKDLVSRRANRFTFHKLHGTRTPH